MAKPKEGSKKPETRDAVTYEVKQPKQPGVHSGFRRTFTRSGHGDEFEKRGQEWADHFGAEEV